MPSRQIQKLPGTLRRIFAAAAAVLASQFGAATLLGMATDRTAEEAARLGLNEARLSKVAQAAFNIHYPEDRAAYLVPMLQGFFSVGAKLRDENTFARKRNENYEFYGMAFKHPLFGYDGLLDRATFHATSKFAQCNIIISSDALRLDKVKRMLTGMDSRQVANFPGEIKDYQKIFLLHELAHCRQIPSTDTEMLETGADIASLSDYLAHGGNKDVARAIMYGRVINGVMAYLSDADAESGGRLYAMGPILNHRFFGGPAITQDESRRAHETVAATLARLAGPENQIDLYDPGMAYALAGKALAEASGLGPQDRLLLTLHREAFEFFMRPRQGPAPALSQAPGV